MVSSELGVGSLQRRVTVGLGLLDTTCRQFVSYGSIGRMDASRRIIIDSNLTYPLR